MENTIRVKCFGNFEVFFNGEPMHFKRSKTKELFAFLVDRNGAGVTAKQICASLWEDESNDKKNMNYLYQLFDDLRTTLSAIGKEEILLRKGYFYSFDTTKFSCDYYEYMQTGVPEFYGEYMTQYTWAEEKVAILYRRNMLES
jgi:two-component SAPR family response regulator